MHRFTLLLICIALLFASCSTQKKLLTDDEKIVLIDKAKAYLIRHGFTDEPHPENLPVENIDVLDKAIDKEIVIERRFNSVKKDPYCIGVVEDGYIVAFKKTDPDIDECPTVIKFDNSENITLYHDCIKPSYLNDCKKL